MSWHYPWAIVEDPLDTIDHPFVAKVEEEADAKIHQAEVGEDLLGMNRRETIERFDLDDDTALDEKIDTKPVLEGNAVVDKVDRALPIDAQPAPMKCAGKK